MGNPGTTSESSSNPADSTDASSIMANATEASSITADAAVTSSITTSTTETSPDTVGATEVSSNTANTTEASADGSKTTKNKKINRNTWFTMKEILSQKVALYGDYLKKLHYSDPTQSGSGNIDTDTAFEEDLAYFKEMRAMYRKRNEN